MNAQLQLQYTREEVHAELQQMAPLKSLGLDGFSACFYQSYWPIIGAEVSKAVLQFLNEGVFDKEFNFTYIVLIPKVTNPTRAKEFRPINLCNDIYKLASNVLANRLKPLLPTIISRTQSAFIPGLLLIDNFITTYEVLHTMTTRQNGNNGSMALKLDMEKAYDRVE